MADPTLTPEQLDGDHVPRLRPAVTHVPVEDEAVLHDADTNALHVLDPIAAIVVGLFDGSVTVAGIVDDLAAVFEAPRERIEADVTAMVRDLAANGLLDGVAGTVDHGPPARIERALVDGC